MDQDTSAVAPLKGGHTCSPGDAQPIRSSDANRLAPEHLKKEPTSDLGGPESSGDPIGEVAIGGELPQEQGEVQRTTQILPGIAQGLLVDAGTAHDEDTVRLAEKGALGLAQAGDGLGEAGEGAHSGDLGKLGAIGV